MHANALRHSATALLISLISATHAGVVTDADDSGPGSLRQTIADAVPGATITFHPSLSGGTIWLTSGQLTLDKDLIIDGSTLASPVTIDASEAVDPQRVLEVAVGVAVVVDTLTITGGETPEADGSVSAGHGGAILNAGTLTIRNGTIRNNTTGYGGDYDTMGGGGGSGGAIFNSGELTIENSTISHNTTGSGGIGFGDFYYGYNHRRWSSYRYLVDPDGGYGGPGGSGGGICNLGTLTVRGATIHSNTTGRGGDGIHVPHDANHGEGGGRGGDGGGIFNAGILIVANSTIRGNITGDGGGGEGIDGVGGFGGGIHNQSGNLTVENSTISENSTGEGLSFGGSGGGIFAEAGTLIVRNVTIAKNTTGYGGSRGGAGAGIYNRGAILTVENATISGNVTGNGLRSNGGVGGIYIDTGTLNIANSIVAGNVGWGVANLDNRAGTVTFAGHNLTSGNPMLAPLGYHGGPTRTMPPLYSSPAIDSGIATATTPATDQRGLPRIAGGVLDLGALETGNLNGYAAWAAQNIPADRDASFTGDADKDGHSNGMEYGTGTKEGLAFTLTPEGARISFGYRPEAAHELIWRVLRSTDLQTFTEILRIDGGVPTVPEGDQLFQTPTTYTLLDTNPPSGRAFYRLEVELIAP